MEILEALIEIPKGDDRRRHMKYDYSGFVDLGPIKDSIPVNGGIMPVHYGYILNTINKEENGEHEEEVDVLVISDRKTSVGEIIKIEPIGLIKREDKDDKVIAVEYGNSLDWDGVPEQDKKLIIDYFGYKSKIISVDGKDEALALIKKSLKS